MLCFIIFQCVSFRERYWWHQWRNIHFSYATAAAKIQSGTRGKILLQCGYRWMAELLFIWGLCKQLFASSHTEIIFRSWCWFHGIMGFFLFYRMELVPSATLMMVLPGNKQWLAQYYELVLVPKDSLHVNLRQLFNFIDWISEKIVKKDITKNEEN